MIEFRKISKKFGNRTVIQDLDLFIKKGEFVCITGPSGAGKSTLIQMLIGHIKPTGGNILIDGTHVETMDFEMIQLLRRKLGIVFQDYKLLPQKTVFENVSFALEVCGKSDAHIHKLVPRVLDIVGLLERQDQYPDELSGGEQQRTAIARALVHNPKLIIADEPTGNLDSIASKNVIDLFADIHQSGTTIILTTHNSDIIKYIDERVVILGDGGVSFDGKVSDLSKPRKKKA